MWFSVSEQLIVTLYSFIVGIGFGILYDVIRISRCIIGVARYSSSITSNKNKLFHQYSSEKVHTGIVSDIIIFLGDIIFSILCAAIYSLFLFHTIRGQLRIYFIIASALGFFIYYFTISKLILAVMEFITNLIKSIVRVFLKIIFIPVHPIIRILRKGSRVLKKVFLSFLCHINPKSFQRFKRKKTEK